MICMIPSNRGHVTLLQISVSDLITINIHKYGWVKQSGFLSAQI